MRLARVVRPMLIASCMAIALAGTALAAGSSEVWIEITGIGPTETFVTSGGVLCPEGTSENTFEKFGGSFAGAAGSFHGYKTLTCADGSGSFRITYDAATVFGSPQDQGGWHVVDGTDDYAEMRGGGNLVGTYIPGGIIDLYTGRVSLH